MKTHETRPGLSLCMIVRDNEGTLPAALASIGPWVDEMVVVDTGSTDRTKRIAEEHGAYVFDFEWCDDFAAARNESLGHARHEWVLWMDSDDTISEENGRRLRDLIASDEAKKKMAFVMQVHCGEDSARGLTVVDHVKLFRNVPAIRFEGRIHEQVLPSIRRLGGEVEWTDIYVSHSGADYSPEGQARKLERDLRILAKDAEERPDHPFVLFNLGMTHGNAGDHGKAIQLLDRCVRVSQTSESHVRKAYALLVGALRTIGQPWEARKRCWEGLGRYPDDIELLFLSGVMAQEAGQLDEAERAYRTILEAEQPRHFSSVDSGVRGYKTRQNLATTLERMDRWAEAEKEWRTIHRETPDYREGWRGLMDNLLSQKKFDDLDEFIAEADGDGGSGVEIVIVRAKVSEARGELSSAKDILKRATLEFPDDLGVRHARCKLLFESEDEQAESALRELAELDADDGSIPHNLGLVMIRSDRWAEAVETFDRSLELRPRSASTLFHRGQALLKLDQGERAMESFEAAVEIDPTHPEASRTIRALGRN